LPDVSPRPECREDVSEADIARTTNGGLAPMSLNRTFNYATAFEMDFWFSSSPWISLAGTALLNR
jgi:hypothetical protein